MLNPKILTKTYNLGNVLSIFLMKFYKIWRTYSWVYSGHNCSCISNKTCVIRLSETFYFNDIVQN